MKPFSNFLGEWRNADFIQKKSRIHVFLKSDQIHLRYPQENFRLRGRLHKFLRRWFFDQQTFEN